MIFFLSYIYEQINICKTISEASQSVPKIGLSLKPNHHSQVKRVQIPGTHGCIAYTTCCQGEREQFFNGCCTISIFVLQFFFNFFFVLKMKYLHFHSSSDHFNNRFTFYIDFFHFRLSKGFFRTFFEVDNVFFISKFQNKCLHRK